MSNPQPRRNIGPAILPGGNTAENRRRAHLRRYLADLPDPEEFAYHLGERELIGLRTAWQMRDGWRVRVDYQHDCFLMGLCEAHGPFLTAFGLAVRRVVMRGDA